jgi:hypothetical protein
MSLRATWLAVLFFACKPAIPPIEEQPLAKRELAGVSLSLPLATHERSPDSWYAGESFSRLRSGGLVQVLWRSSDPPRPSDPADPEGHHTGLTALLREAAQRLGGGVVVQPPGETTVAKHLAVTAELGLDPDDSDARARLTTWYCPKDKRLMHVLVSGAGLEVHDRILGSIECHTWSRERREQTLRVATFDPPEGFVKVASDEEGSVRWERGPEVLLLSFGLPTTPAVALAATRRSMPAGLTDLEEKLLVGPDQQPRARLTGNLPGEHTAWRYTFDLLDCGDGVYLATHSMPTGHPGATPHPLERVRCPGK